MAARCAFPRSSVPWQGTAAQDGQWTQASEAGPMGSPLWFSGPKKEKSQLLEIRPRGRETGDGGPVHGRGLLAGSEMPVSCLLNRGTKCPHLTIIL